MKINRREHKASLLVQFIVLLTEIAHVVTYDSEEQSLRSDVSIAVGGYDVDSPDQERKLIETMFTDYNRWSRPVQTQSEVVHISLTLYVSSLGLTSLCKLTWPNSLS